MRILATLLATTLLLAGAAAATAATTPRLRVVTAQPLVVRGDGFRPRERIVVTASTMIGPKRVVVRATARGTFRATIRLADQPCGDAVWVRALGARGSRAWIDVPSRPCIPPPVR